MIMNLWWKSESTGTAQAKSFTMTCFYLDLNSSGLAELEAYSDEVARVFGMQPRMYLLKMY